jgi:Flp pilus assembly protein TadG
MKTIPTSLDNREREHGIVAVELAMIMPLLMLVLFAIIECGRYYNATIATTHAAREAVRTVALSTGSPQGAATSAASPLSVSAVSLTTCPLSGTGANASVRVDHSFSYDIPFFRTRNITISRTAVMRCGG